MTDVRAEPFAGRRTTPPHATRRWSGVRSWRGWPDVLVAAGYLALGGWVTARLWIDLSHRVQSNNVQDQGFFEFALAHAARSVSHLSNPLFTDRINVPDGVNMMANTSILGLGIPLTPVTLVFGAPTAYALLLTLGLAGTAFAWYFVLRRTLLTSRFAAIVAGGFAGFAPGLVSQANGHPNVVAQFMVPLIGWQVLRLCQPRDLPRGAVLRRGLVLGLLVTYQAFINEEILLFTAAAIALTVVVFALARRVPLRQLALGLAVAGALAIVLLAYPLWYQFRGPQHYGAVPALSVTMHADVLSFGSYATESLAGDPATQVRFNAHPAEQNAYFGWPLLIVLVVAVGWLWRNLAVRSAAIVALVFGVLSLGSPITVNGRNTGVHGPFGLLNGLPLIESVVPGRLTLVCIPALAVLLGITIDRILPLIRPAGFAPKLLGVGALAAMLLPIAPTPLAAIGAPATPRFVTSGQWRQYVPVGRTLVTVPLASYLSIDGQRWAARADLSFPIPRGYFLGPNDAKASGRALYGAPPRPTATLLEAVALGHPVPAITDIDRANAHADLAYWRAGVVVLGAEHRETALLATVTALLGPPTRVQDVWLWVLA